MGWAECVIRSLLTMSLLIGILGALILHFWLIIFSLALIISYNICSAADGPNFLAQELGLLENMELAIKEERYREAGI